MAWGAPFVDPVTGVTYMNQLPNDPQQPASQFLLLVSTDRLKYQLFAHVENVKDEDISTDSNVTTRFCGSTSYCNMQLQAQMQLFRGTAMKHTMRNTTKHTMLRGFTLIELLIVITIIGTLAGLLFTNFSGARERARDSKRKSDVTQMKNALRLYYNDYQVIH